MTRRANDIPPAPKHLRPATRKWYSAVNHEYTLEDHHRRILQAAGECWDRAEMAREALKKHGMIFTDRFGQPRARPEISIERDAKIGFLRALRELGLDVQSPDEFVRPNRLPEAGRLRAIGE